jgi:hypothetical protein
MDQIIFLRNRDSLNSLFSENSEIGIILPERHTMDVISAGLALYLSLKASGKDVQIVSKTTPLVEHSNLFGIDKISKSFDGKIRKLTIAVPYVEGEIEKVSYDKDETNKKLLVNFISEEHGITFNESEVEYIRKGTVPSLIITLGISGQNELSGFIDNKTGVKMVAISNNQLKDHNADVVYADTAFSSISEVVGKIMTMHGLVIDPDIAQNLLDGVVSATNNYTSDRTSSAAFEVTGVAMRAGAKRKKEMPRPQQKSNLENLVRFDNRNDNKNDRRNDQRRDDRRRDERHDNSRNPLRPSTQSVSHHVSSTISPDEIEEYDLDDNSNQQQADVMKTEVVHEEKKEKIPSDWFVPKIYKGDKTN